MCPECGERAHTVARTKHLWRQSPCSNRTVAEDWELHPTRTRTSPLAMQRHSSLGGSAPGPAGPDLDLIAVDPGVRKSIEVLVVDDEHSLRESCASLLRSQGFSVTVCGRGDEALRTVNNRRFDIALFDLYMAQVAGLELLEATIRAQPDTIVIVMTGNPTVESSVTALQA